MIVDIQAERGEGKTTLLSLMYESFRADNPDVKVLFIFPSGYHLKETSLDDPNTICVTCRGLDDYLPLTSDIAAVFADEAQIMSLSQHAALQGYGRVAGNYLVQTWTATE